MTDVEKTSTLADLHFNKTSLLDELKRLPLTSETLKTRRRKIEIELKLNEIDLLFEKFQKNKILIKSS